MVCLHIVQMHANLALIVLILQFDSNLSGTIRQFTETASGLQEKQHIIDAKLLVYLILVGQLAKLVEK